VEIHESADVHAFLMGEPWLLPCGGYGSVAAKADGVTGSIFVVPVLKVEAVGGWLERGVGHKVAAFEQRTSMASTILRFGYQSGYEIRA
jgi:hypothetical protein